MIASRVIYASLSRSFALNAFKISSKSWFGSQSLPISRSTKLIVPISYHCRAFATTTTKPKTKSTKKKGKSKAKKAKVKAKPKGRPQIKITKFDAVTPKYVYANSILSDLKKQKFTTKTSLEAYLSSRYSALTQEEQKKFRMECRKIKARAFKKKLPPAYSEYVLFVRDNAERFRQGRPLTTVIKEISADWKSLDDEKRRVYKQQSQEMFDAYYKKKEELTTPKVNTSAYTQFIKESFANEKDTNPTYKPQELLKDLAKKWSMMTDGEKEQFKK